MNIPSTHRQTARSSRAGSNLAAPGTQQPGQLELPTQIADMVYLIPPRKRLADLVLTTDVVEQCTDFLSEFSQAALLRAHSLEPRHTLLLIGPPGNGKTSLAEAMAAETGLPLLSLRYDAILGSYLGETQGRMRKLIDFATDVPVILFFDEFEAMGAERSNAHETGEIKRVVSSLLVQLDKLPSHTVVVCATNHPDLLDRAVWRRFELILNIAQANRDQLTTWFKRFELSMDGKPTGIQAEQFADCMQGQNMSAVEDFTLNVRRKPVLSKGTLAPAAAVEIAMKQLRQRPAIGQGSRTAANATLS